ncbi:bifunctional DNA primase/polymerase [Chitinophaga sp. CC14]|uniref:bifunctional DNA primase/polymerase n=1 Tax=Chitinophaga sp. CC14 TaxID=3029199 RepID=UPI003B7F7A7C
MKEKKCAVMESLFKTACNYLRLGLSVIAVDQNKAAVLPWQQFQHRLPTQAEIFKMCNYKGASGLALVCGQVSDGLEVIDIDLKYDLSGNLFQRLTENISSQNPGLMERLLISQSRSKGIHLIYRCNRPGPGRHLARRPTTPKELKDKPKEKAKVLIETLGEGCIVVIPPTKGYSLLQGDYLHLPILSPQDANLLYHCSEAFNLYSPTRTPSPQVQVNYDPGDLSNPFADFNFRGDIIGLLQSHGWRKLAEKDNKTTFLRPGDTDKSISGSYHHIKGVFFTFSTSTEFENKKGYRPSTVFTILECDGNRSLARSKLLNLGFGKLTQKNLLRARQFTLPAERTRHQKK